MPDHQPPRSQAPAPDVVPPAEVAPPPVKGAEKGLRVARDVRLALVVIALALLIGLPLFNSGGSQGEVAAEVPGMEVFPFKPEANAASDDYHAVVGVWSEGKAPWGPKRPVSIDPHRRLVVRVYDLDGWVMSGLISGRLKVEGGEELQKDARNWAKSLRTKKPDLENLMCAAVQENIKKTAEEALKAETAANLELEAARHPAAGGAALPAAQIKAAEDKAAVAAAAAVKAKEELARHTKRREEAMAAFTALFNHVRKTIVVNLNGHSLPNTSPVNFASSQLPDSVRKTADRVDDLIFTPNMEDAEVHNIFRNLAKGVGFKGAMTVTLAYVADKDSKDGLQLSTLLSPASATPSQRPYVSFVPWWKFWWIVAYMGGIGATLGYLAYKTSLLRALDGRRRPDGHFQLSLTHTQLAMWFVVVLGSYFYLWVITGELDNTFSDTGLYLVGISIVAAFGSHAIQGLGAPSTTIATYNQAMSTRVGRPPEEIRQDIEACLEHTQEEWQLAARARDDAANAGDVAPAVLAALEQKATRLFETCEDLRRQRRYMNATPPFRWLTDLLSENGEVTIHRFQMLAWTLGLGFIFCAKVFTELQMPTFPPQVLALMGISAGTYLGFRIPETQRIKETLADPSKLSPPAGKREE